MEYKFDFHIHTKYSYDSISSPRRILSKAKKIGLKGIAITDHNTMDGALETYKLNRDPNFIVILGEEIKTEHGEIIGLFLNKEIKSKEFVGVTKEIKAQRGIVVLAHPFKRIMEINQKLLPKIDVLEVLNSRITQKQNKKAQNLTKITNKSGIGGSDAHLISEIGNTYTIFNDTSDLKKNILEGNCKIEGSLSSRYVHYISAFIGNYRKGTLCKTIFEKVFSKNE